jgi:hypothetical protein
MEMGVNLEILKREKWHNLIKKQIFKLLTTFITKRCIKHHARRISNSHALV